MFVAFIKQYKFSIKNTKTKKQKSAPRVCCIPFPIPIAMKKALPPKILKSRAPDGPLMNKGFNVIKKKTFFKTIDRNYKER